MSRFVKFEQKNTKIQTFGGPSRQMQQKGCFYYGGPQQQRRAFDSEKVPSFETIAKNRMLMEQRVYLNNSNTKCLRMGIIPASKILSPEADGFHVEVYLDGEKCAPLPLGGVKGLAALLTTIRDIPEFSKIPPIAFDVAPGENILISTTNFAKDVYKIQNSELDDERAVYLAASGLYEIIKNERFIMAGVSAFKPYEIEVAFNKSVQSAVKDYNAFCAAVQHAPNKLELELLTNFVDLFELVIDIKKAESEKTAADTAAAIIAAAAVEDDTQPPKSKRSRS